MAINKSNNKPKNNVNKHYIKGFTLVEISIVLLIIGILMGAVLKGKSLIESVKLDSVVDDVRTIQTAYSEYINITSTKPDTNEFFKQMKTYELIESENFKAPKVGGSYSIIEHDSHQYLHLNNLTEKQITILQAKLKASFGEYLNTKIDDNNKTSISIQVD